MASRLKSSPVREGAKALQPLGLVALVGIVGTVTLLGGCGSGSSYSNNTEPSPLIPVPVASGVTPTPTPTPSGSPGTGSPGPSPSGSASPTPTPTATPTPDPNNLRLTQALDLIRANTSASVTALALGPDDRWAVAYNIAGATPTDPVTFGYYLPAGAPAGLRTALEGLKASTPSAQIRSITLGTGNTWLMTYNGTSNAYTDYQEQDIDVNMRARLISLRLNQNITVKAAAIGADPATWAMVVNQNGYYSQNLPAELETLLNTYPTNAAITVDDIALGSDNTYAVVYNNNQIAGNATALVNFVNNSAGPIRTNNSAINGIALGLAGSYAVVYNNNQYSSSGTTRSR
jgi:hypothetical protein